MQQKGAYKRLELILAESAGLDLARYFQALLQG